MGKRYKSVKKLYNKGGQYSDNICELPRLKSKIRNELITLYTGRCDVSKHPKPRVLKRVKSIIPHPLRSYYCTMRLKYD